jgi:hypothetical protein
MLDLKAAAKDWLTKRETGFAHDRSKTIGASEIGQCARKVWFEKKKGKSAYRADYHPPLGAAFRGDILEDHYTTKVIAAAVAKQLGPPAELIWAGQENQMTIKADAWKLSATPDGLIINAPRNALANYGVEDILGDCLLTEVKSFDPRILEATLPKPEHIDQLNTQLGLLRKDGSYLPAFGILVYVNASFVDDIRIFPVQFDKFAFDNQVRRALAIMNAEKAEALRPEGLVAGGKECAYCPFSHICLGFVPSMPKTKGAIDFDTADPAYKNKVRSTVASLDMIRNHIKHWESAEAEAVARLKEAMILGNMRAASGKLTDGRAFDIKWTKAPGRETLLKDKIIKRLEEIGDNPDDYIKRGFAYETVTTKVFGTRTKNELVGTTEEIVKREDEPSNLEEETTQ